MVAGGAAGDDLGEAGSMGDQTPAFTRVRPAPALSRPPELFALGRDLVEECIAEVSKAHAKGIE